MGLTINFGIESNTNSPKVARQLLEKIRQIALDTPFEHVGEVGEYFNVDDPRDWHLIQSSEYIRYPWNNHISTAVYPEHLYVFSIAVGNGCEELNIGLGKYPKTLVVDYRPYQDTKFLDKDGRFSYSKWSDYARKKGIYALDYEKSYPKEIKTNLSRYRWGSFCKTEYTSLPDCGGIENFIRCHLNIIKFLDKVKLIPKLDVFVDDEGEYGDFSRNNIEYNGTYSLQTLLKNKDVSAQSIAALVGQIKDTVGSENLFAPILKDPNFEQLEFRGSK